MSGYHWSDHLRAAFKAGRTTTGTFEEWLERNQDFGSIEDLDLPIRAYNALKREGIHTIADLRKLLSGHWSQFGRHMMDIKNVGWKTYDETVACLAQWDRVMNERKENA